MPNAIGTKVCERLACRKGEGGLRFSIAAQGIEVHTGTAQAAQAFIEGQIDVWVKVVRDHTIKAE